MTITKLENIERLPKSILETHYGKFQACETFWIQDKFTTIEFLQQSFSSCQRINIQTRGRSFPYYEWSNISAKLIKGEVVEDMFNMYRIKTGLLKCATCGRSIEAGLEAYSRILPSVTLCSKCGENEAIEDYYEYRE